MGQCSPTVLAGSIAKLEIQSRMVTDRLRSTATSANENTTYFACRTTFAQVFSSFSRSLVSDQWSISPGNSSRPLLQQFVNQPAVFQLAGLGAVRPEIEVSAVERDEGITADAALLVGGDCLNELRRREVLPC